MAAFCKPKERAEDCLGRWPRTKPHHRQGMKLSFDQNLSPSCRIGDFLDQGELSLYDIVPSLGDFKRARRGLVGGRAKWRCGGLNEVKVLRTNDFSQVAAIPVGALPHGLWPSGDGTAIYVCLENGDAVTAIDMLTNKVIGTTAIGQRTFAEPRADR